MPDEPISVSAQHAKEEHLSRQKTKDSIPPETVKPDIDPVSVQEKFEQLQKDLKEKDLKDQTKGTKTVMPGQEDNMIRISISHKFRKKDEVAWISVPFSREEVMSNDPVIGEIKVKVITLVEEIKKNFDDAMDLAEPLVIYAPEKKKAEPIPDNNGSSSPMCNHGEMIFKQGKSKESGKPWAGFFCTERNRDNQCEPKWSKVS